MTINHKVKAGVIISSIAVAAIVSAALILQNTDARQPLHVVSAHGGPAYINMFDFGPCDQRDNQTDPQGTWGNPARVKQGGTSVIHICGENLDPVAKTYTFTVWDVNNQTISPNASSQLPPIPFHFDKLPQGGIHVSFPKAISVSAYSQAAGMPAMTNLTTPQDIKNFLATHYRGKNPDPSNFEIQVSADKNATLGIHAFALVQHFPAEPAGEHVNAKTIVVNVVP